MDKLEYIDRTIARAQNWRDKSEPGWVNHCLTSSILGLLSFSLSEAESAAGAKEFLVARDIVRLLSMEVDALNDIADRIDSGAMGPSSLGGNYTFLVFAHICLLLEEKELAKIFVSFANSAVVREISTPFWNEYATALRLMFEEREYEPQPLELKGQEKYWKCYLDLVAAYTSDRFGVHDMVRVAKESFDQRNNDKSISDDHYAIEGSGRATLRVDFRLESLLTYLAVPEK